MRRALVIVLFLASSAMPAVAEPVRICETVDGSIIVAHIYAEPERVNAEIMARFPGAVCWAGDSATLPPRDRPDPRLAGATVTQRHRWRRSGSDVVADAAVMRPHGSEILREMAKALPPARMAALLTSPVGDNFVRAIRSQSWPLAKALMGQIAARVGTAQEVMTAAEVAQLRAIARDYEADLEEGSP